MYDLVTAIGVVTVATWFTGKVWKWINHHHNARVMGFPVFYSPVHISSVWWKVFEAVLPPLLEKFPSSLTQPWLSVSNVWTMWQSGHKAFGLAGSDTFVLASPGGNMIWTCDNTIIKQLYNSHPKIEVPVEHMGFFELYGPTVFTVQGDKWKTHRRAITSGLGSAVEKGVWKESSRQTESLIKHWREQKGSVVPVIRHDTANLALHVIANSFYGIPMDWNKKNQDDLTTDGHTLTFDKALFYAINHLGILFMLPIELLKRLPYAAFREAYLGFTELTRYIDELKKSAASDVTELSHKKNKTLLESLVLSSSDPEVTGKIPISSESVTGNIFFTMLAGHETTGGTLGFIFLLISIYPEYQRKVQAELDAHFGSRPKSEWTYEQDFKALQKGWIGALQKETLYLYVPAGFVMRKALEPVVLLDCHGQKHCVPEGSLFLINNAASNHHPSRQKLRPEVTQERFLKLSKSPALYFNPERWLGFDDRPDDTKDAEEASLPYFHVFGGGGRTCPGRGFAQTEMTSVMATILKDFSLELVVDEKTLQAHNNDRIRAHEAVRDKAIAMLYNDVLANVTISLEKPLPIRVVPRV